MSAEISPGTLVNNRYLIQKTLGRGGFGRTYLAFNNQRFNEPCVLKEFLPDTQSPSIIIKSKELFEREAKVLYQIKHQQIPQFLALLTHEDKLFIVQEYIDGRTYLQILDDRLSSTRKPFSEAEVRQWLLDMLPVLEYIHGCNIIHRDISLENVMLPNNQSQPVLIDFGVVKEKFTQIFSSSSSHSFKQGSVVGKIGYSPPEQLRLGHCFPSSDLYALAVSALILLTGKMPHLLIDDSLNWNWQSHVNVSSSLATILNKMLASVPAERYQSATEVIAKLENNQSYNSNVSQTVNDNNLKPKMSLGGIISSILPRRTQQNEQQNVGNENNFELLGQTLVSQNPQFVDYCKQQLASFIGPLASMVMEQTLQENPDITSKDFVEVLAQKIPDTQRAESFRNHIKFLKEYKTEQPQKLSQSVSSLTTTPAISHPDFLDYCRREFSSFVGPFASVVIRDTLDENPDLTPKQLVERLMTGIPNRKRAKEFQKRILKD
ncbi:serine/threonine protein kinase [Calothrix parasitica NIES-267]|uniref:non-specific serine/threonine protein kinase n=1 Tax=Calothrix parasitica NIES-267 TaxID=1973488 RepID=A0A1Z4M1T1_9CYAN|nr:serine/threonine protein kinase [Calothrix parasitica NIES-267]